MTEQENSEITAIIDEFNWKIKKSLANTSFQEREDLEQEIKLKLIEKLHTVEFSEPSSFWSFVS
ncbi:MAG: hypothetical protein ACQEWU_04810 [Bacillota bacterium]